MKSALLVASSMLAAWSCTASGPNASPRQCEKPCAHAVDLKLAPMRASEQSRVHEIDEQVDATEESAAKAKVQVKQEMAQPPPYFNPKAFSHLPVKTQRELQQRHDWEVAQLKVQRELALQRADAAVQEVKQKFERMKAEADAENKQATDAALKECAAECTRRPPGYAECLQRTQAVEDIAVCQRQ